MKPSHRLLSKGARGMTAHPDLRAEQFADPMFLKVRSQVARLRLPRSLPAGAVAAAYQHL
jgi:hypothetical protein